MLGEIGGFRKGANIPKRLLSAEGIKCVLYGEIYTKYDDVVLEFDSTISLEAAIEAKPLSKGDILFAGSGETAEDIGKCIAYMGDELAYAGGDLIILTPEAGDSRFFGYMLNTPIVARQKSAKGQGSSVFHIYSYNLKTILVPFPPLPEQRAIAKVLSDVDAQIAALEALIAKKRAIMQGAMQELLTGRRRLPDFSGEWEVKKLWEIGSFFKGGNIPKKALQDQGLPCVLYGEIYTAYDAIAEELHSRISPELASRSVSIQRGDILFAGSGETAEEIGKCFAYLGHETGYAGGDLIALRPYDADSAFLAFLLNSPMVAEQKARLGQGSSVVHIYIGNLRSVEVRIPKADEQSAIGSILLDMRHDIRQFEASLGKSSLLKQGLMQELLTGKTRLI